MSYLIEDPISTGKYVTLSIRNKLCYLEPKRLSTVKYVAGQLSYLDETQ